jgi:hypothetical protein
MIAVLKQFVLLFVLGSFGTVSKDITVRLELDISALDNMRQVQPETLPKNSNFSSCLQNIKLKNNTT